MAKQKLFPASTSKASDKREPHERFTVFASKIVTVTKAEIDKRETEWRRHKKRPT